MKIEKSKKTNTFECIRVYDLIILFSLGVRDAKKLCDLAEERFGKESSYYEYARGMLKGLEDIRAAFNKMRKDKVIKVGAPK